jgi:hypothetical protein
MITSVSENRKKGGADKEQSNPLIFLTIINNNWH